MIRLIQILPAILAVIVTVGCGSSREFWQYVVEEEMPHRASAREKGEQDSPRILSPHNVKIVYNDGSVSTEVLVPVLSSGQQIIVDHKAKGSAESLKLLPVPPTDADKSVEDAYVASGQPISKQGAPVSIIKTHEKIRDLAKAGQYELALQYADQLLKRYPNHVKTLRTKGSLLLKMGEREAALKAYTKAQEIEPDTKVGEQINAIEKQMNGSSSGAGDKQ